MQLLKTLLVPVNTTSAVPAVKKYIPVSDFMTTIAIISSLLVTGCEPTNDSDIDKNKTTHSDSIENNHLNHNNEQDEHHHNDGHHTNKQHSLDEHAHSPQNDHAGHNHDMGRLKYECEPKFTIGAYYHKSTQPETAHLLIDGIEYDFTADKTANLTGNKQMYISEYGFEDSNRLVWEVADDEATLYTVSTAIKDKKLADANLKKTHHCHQLK